MNQERYKERILETENLTDELEDEEANWLLEWGIGRLNRVLRDAADEETADNRVSALMAVMRKINKMVGSSAGKNTQVLADDLADLRDAFCAAFPATVAFPFQPDLAAAAVRLSQLSPRPALEFLAQEFFP